jgi:hypothetical protein
MTAFVIASQEPKSVRIPDLQGPEIKYALERKDQQLINFDKVPR